jgi:hypothetical protein
MCAFYTGSVMTEELQANSHSNSRTVFKLGSVDKVYLTNMRLMNIGVISSASGVPINRLSGLYSCIRRIEILDGDVSLDLMDNFNDWAQFRNYNKPNDKLISEMTRTSKNDMGFMAYHQGQNSGSDFRAHNLDTPNQVSTLEITDASTAKAWMSMKDFVSILDDFQFLPTRIFNNLKIVIEWETDIQNISPGTGASISEIVRPWLVVDSIADEQMKMDIVRNYKGGLYRPIEVASVYSPSIIADKSQSWTLTGFNNKTVNRMVLQKAPTSTTVSTYGKLDSVGLHDASETNTQEYQLVVSGQNLLPENGYDSLAKCLRSVTESWGDCNSMYLNLDVSNPVANEIVQDTAERVGWQNYVNFDVNQFCKQIQFKMKRPYNANAYYSQALNLHIFAEVNKVIIVALDGSYVVRYV